MPKKLNLICHLERLWPVYAAGFVDFSLNIQLAFTAGDTLAAADAAFLKPWKANWSGVRVFGLHGTDVPSMIAAADITVLAGPALDTNAIASSYDAAFPAGDQEAWRVNPATPRASIPVTKTSQPWIAFQAQQARGPAGIPIAMGLTIVFRIDQTKLAGFEEIAAAPVFGVASAFGAAVAPATPTNPVDDAGAELHRTSVESYSWIYSNPPFPVIEYVNACPWAADPPASDSVLDLKQLWVKTRANPIGASRDWSTEFEVRLADAFDMPQRLLEALTQIDGAAPSWIADFHSAFVTSLRDTVNTGIHPAPDGSSLADFLLAEAPIAKPKALLQNFENAMTPATWLAELQSLLPTLDPLTRSIPAPPAEGFPVGDYVQALSHFRSVMGSPAALNAVLLNDWNVALTPFSDADRNNLAQAAQRVDLRKRFLLGNLLAHWTNLTGKLSDPAVMKAALSNRLQAYGDGLFGGAGKLPKPIADKFTLFASKFVDSQLSSATVDCTNPPSGPEELVLQVADLQRASGNDADDPIRHVAGVGVLLKATQSNTWRCLSLANVVTQGRPTGVTAQPVPKALQYRNGVRQPFVAYHNEPLICHSPAEGFARNGQFKSDGPALGGVFDYLNPYGQNGLQLEGLFYKRDYDAAIFLFGPAGNLPVQIADPAAPGAFKAPGSAFNAPLLQRVEFRRRTTVGSVRFNATSASELTVPGIPPDVRPLARSLQPDGAKTPLILLIPPPAVPEVWNRRLASHIFEFGLKPPSAPMQTWFRWVGPGNGNGFTTDECSAVIGAYAERNDVVPAMEATPQQSGDKKQGPSALLDDPAIGSLKFSMQLIAGTAVVIQDVVAAPVPNTNADPLAKVQSLPRIVHVESIQPGVGVTASMNLVNNKVTIMIPAGEVWNLRIRPVVSDPTRFASEIRQCVDGTTSPQFGEVNVFLEVAANWPLPVPAIASAVSKALKPTFNPITSLLQASLRIATDQDKIWARYLQRVDVLVQQWRWDGRPPFHVESGKSSYGYPLATPPDTTDQPYAEDAVLFASRLTSDREENPKEVDYSTSPVGAYPLYTKDMTAVTATQYFRFGLRAYSRYSGLMVARPSIDSVLDSDTSVERWKRLVMQCRWTKPVPKPAIKLVVPLTRTLSAAETPGLLVVLHESWYGASFGLAEYLEASIEQVALPDVDGDTRLQFGPDPLLTMEPDPYGGMNVTLPQAIGASGYTFDTVTQAPLWVRSSFYQPPPQVNGQDLDLSWHFVKLRFRRTLAGVAVDSIRRPASLASDWTDGVWTQLLPPSDRIRVSDSETVLTDDLRFDPLSGVISRTSGPVTPQVTAVSGGNCRFALYALITRAVADVAGRIGQEAAFPGLVPIGSWPAIASADADRLILRLVEIQYRDGTDLSNIDDKLFTPSANGVPQDAKARIVRVWLPIPNGRVIS